MVEEWYRWENKEDAEAALNFINNHPSLPHIGINLKTNLPDPDSCKTEKWRSEVVECKDGKFGFLRIASIWLDILEISMEDRVDFLTNYVYGKGGAIEEFNDSWI
jgi:hypothetical protein